MLFFTFIKGGVTPLTGPPNLNGFSSIIKGGGVKSLLTNANKKMFFFNEGFPKYTVAVDIPRDLKYIVAEKVKWLDGKP